MEQFNVNGLPVTILSTDVVRLFPTTDGSFFMLRVTTTGYPSSGALYHIKRTGDSFDYLSTIATVSGTSGSSYPRSIFGYNDVSSGYLAGKSTILVRKTTYTSSTTSTVELFALSLDGAGSLLKTFSIAHNFAVNAWPSSNLGYCINSARSSIVWVVGTTMYEGVIGSATVVASSVGSSMFQSSSAPPIYLGDGVVGFKSASANGLVNMFPMDTAVPSAYSGAASYGPPGATGNTISTNEVIAEFNSTIYRVAVGSGSTRTFAKGYSQATEFTRTYLENDATLPLAEGQPFQYRSEGVYTGAWLFMRHINGAYLMNIETFENAPSYSQANIAAFPGNVDPDKFALAIYGSDAYCYSFDVQTLQPIVIRVPVGDYSQLISQNGIFISPIIGEAVTQVTSELLDYYSRSTLNNELRFLTVATTGTNGQLQQLNELNLKFTDDTLQRKQSSVVHSYGDVVFTTESQKMGTLSNKLIPQTPYIGPRNPTSSINPDMEESYILSIAGGTGFLANRTLTATIASASGPVTKVVENVYPVSHAFTCPYTGNLYLIYTATTNLLMTYIDTTTWQIINTFNVGGYPVLVRVSAENEITFLYGTSNGTTPTNIRTINTLTGALGTVYANSVSNWTAYTYPLGSTTSRPKALNFLGEESPALYRGAINKGVATTLNQDNFASATRGPHVMDNLRIRRAFNQDWYYMRTMALTRTVSGVTTKKTSDYHALMQVSLHEGSPPTRWSLQQFDNQTAFLYESWPNLLKVTPFTLYIPEDTEFEGVPVPVEPETTLKLRLYGWIRGG